MPKNEVQRKTVAYHECGHAVAGWYSKHSSPLLKLTIVPRSKGALGFAQYLPDEISLYTKDQLLDMIKVALGGRVAEELFFGKITTGASDDLKKCTQIAQGMVTEYGMIDSLGTVNYAASDGYQKSYSERTGAMIDFEVKRIINEQYAECKKTLEENREKIEE
jgi:AFG3 family protein